jgi:hypothetical protein
LRRVEFSGAELSLDADQAAQFRDGVKYVVAFMRERRQAGPTEKAASYGNH